LSVAYEAKRTENDIIKNQLLDELFSLEGNHETEKIAILKEKFLKHISKDATNMIDDKLQDGLRLLILHEEEATHDNTLGNFLRLSNIAEPIFVRIENSAGLNVRDLEFLSVSILYTRRVKQAIVLFEYALEELKRYSINHPKWTNKITASFHNTLSIRFLRMDSFEVDDDSDTVEEKLNDALKFCEKHNFQLNACAILVRKGLFFEDKNTINRGLDKLKKLGENKLHEIMSKEVEDYKKRWEGF